MVPGKPVDARGDFHTAGHLVTGGGVAAQCGSVVMIVITAIAVSTILLRRLPRKDRGDWCEGRFSDDGACVRCRQPA